MWIKTLTGKPTEWKDDQGNNSKVQKKIAGTLWKDISEIKNSAREIKLKGWTTFDGAVNLLMKKKAEGKNCFINFYWTKIYSVTTKDIDDAYFQWKWMSKAEYEEKERKKSEESLEELNKSFKQREAKERLYAKKIEDSRKGKESVVITKDVVVAGLKFMAEHPKMEWVELVDNLINLGCNFTREDINKQYPNRKGVKLFSGMREWNILCGATVIAWCVSDGYIDDRFFEDGSAYAFIRKVTGDETYTKENVDSLVKKEK